MTREMERHRMDHFAFFADRLHADLARECKRRGWTPPAPYTHEFLVSWIKRQRSCACCGNDFRVASRRGTLQELVNDVPTLMRVDPSQPFNFGNTAMVCRRCASIKRDFAPHELSQVANWSERWVARQGQAARGVAA